MQAASVQGGGSLMEEMSSIAGVYEAGSQRINYVSWSGFPETDLGRIPVC